MGWSPVDIHTYIDIHRDTSTLRRFGNELMKYFVCAEVVIRAATHSSAPAYRPYSTHTYVHTQAQILLKHIRKAQPFVANSFFRLLGKCFVAALVGINISFAFTFCSLSLIYISFVFCSLLFCPIFDYPLRYFSLEWSIADVLLWFISMTTWDFTSWI